MNIKGKMRVGRLENCLQELISVVDDMNELHKRSLYNIKLRDEKSSDIACTAKCFTAMVNNGYPLCRLEV